VQFGATHRVIGLTFRFAACFKDRRHAALVENSVQTLVTQRICSALGYDDMIDHADLRRDPVMAVRRATSRPGNGEGVAIRGRWCQSEAIPARRVVAEAGCGRLCLRAVVAEAFGRRSVSSPMPPEAMSLRPDGQP